MNYIALLTPQKNAQPCPTVMNHISIMSSLIALVIGVVPLFFITLIMETWKMISHLLWISQITVVYILVTRKVLIGATVVTCGRFVLACQRSLRPANKRSQSRYRQISGVSGRIKATNDGSAGSGSNQTNML